MLFNCSFPILSLCFLILCVCYFGSHTLSTSTPTWTVMKRPSNTESGTNNWHPTCIKEHTFLLLGFLFIILNIKQSQHKLLLHKSQLSNSHSSSLHNNGQMQKKDLGSHKTFPNPRKDQSDLDKFLRRKLYPRWYCNHLQDAAEE